MSYSLDFIKMAVSYKEKGHTFKQLQAAFGIRNQTYYLWKERLANGYYDEPKPKQERSRKIDKTKLKAILSKKPDAYLRELAQPFDCSSQAVFAALKNLGITYKKRPLAIAKSPKNNT